MHDIITTNKNSLMEVVDQNQAILNLLPEDKREEFKKNFYGLAAQEYLIKEINTREIMEVAVNATILGLNVNPIHGECFILPFKKKAMIVPQINGLQQISFDAGFLLEIDSVWTVNGKTEKEKNMSYEELAKTNIADNKKVDEMLKGWVFSLVDLRGEIPPQEKFVSIAYAITVNAGTLGENKASKLIHKACRKAVSTMFIPRDRLSKMEAITRYDDAEIDTAPQIQAQSQRGVDPLQSFKQEPEIIVDVDDSEAESETKLAEIQTMFNQYKKTHMPEMKQFFEAYPNWREADLRTLYEIQEGLQDVCNR